MSESTSPAAALESADERSDEARHVFEEAGLGDAPYRVEAIYWSGTANVCDYCSTVIYQICWLRSADGRAFKVGNVCVEKTGDEGLVDLTRRAIKEFKAKDADRRIEAARALLPQAKPALKSQPHPNEHLAVRGKTLLDYVEYLFEHAGRSGKVKAAKFIESAAPSPDSLKGK